MSMSRYINIFHSDIDCANEYEYVVYVGEDKHGDVFRGYNNVYIASAVAKAMHGNLYLTNLYHSDEIKESVNAIRENDR